MENQISIILEGSFEDDFFTGKQTIAENGKSTEKFAVAEPVDEIIDTAVFWQDSKWKFRNFKVSYLENENFATEAKTFYNQLM